MSNYGVKHSADRNWSHPQLPLADAIRILARPKDSPNNYLGLFGRVGSSAGAPIMV
jgi:hypothetical protein